MRITFNGGPLDGAVLEMHGLPIGPIGIQVPLDLDDVEFEGTKLVIPKTEARYATYWYDWAAIQQESTDERELNFAYSMEQTVREPDTGTSPRYGYI